MNTSQLTFVREVEVENVPIVIYPSWKLEPVPSGNTWRYAMLIQLHYRAVGAKKILRFVETVEMGAQTDPTLLDILPDQNWEIKRLKPYQNGEEGNVLVATKSK